MGKKEKPCERCTAYNRDQGECRLLVSLQAPSLDERNGPEDCSTQPTSRSVDIGELLEDRPCKFSEFIEAIARKILPKRGLNPQDAPDIHHQVVVRLMGLDFRPIRPTYDDFCAYVISIVESVVHEEHNKKHGRYRCGTCTFFSGSNRCGCPSLKPLPGQEWVEVTRGQDPERVIHTSTHSISIDDVRDWSGFCSKLWSDGERATGNPSQRIWELLTRDAQGSVQKAAKLNGHGKIHYLAIVEALDSILENETFYEEIYFSSVQMTKEAENLFQRGLANLTKNEVRRFNRLLLEAAYPGEIVRNTMGCPYYSSRQFVGIDHFVEANNLACVDQPQSDQFESVLKYMESLGPRQQAQAKLIRLKARGDELEEIANQLGKHPNTISKEFWGTNEKEKDGGDYHQAGACDGFRAIYSGAIFDLERKERQLWAVVHQRDFNADPALPPFKKIARYFSISKREAVERYVRGWSWINSKSTRGGKRMPKKENDRSPEGSESQEPGFPIARASEMLHPDYYVLLTYAEGTLDREARKLIAGHILICDYCSTEFKDIEMEMLSATERPFGLAERSRWLAARLLGGMRLAGIGDRSADTSEPAGEISRGNRWPLSARLAFGFALAVAAALLTVLIVSVMYQNRLADRLTAEKREREQEIDRLQEQTQKTAAADQEAQRLRGELAALQRDPIRRRDRQSVPEEMAHPNMASPRTSTMSPDIDGVAIVGREVRIQMAEEGSPAKTFILPPPEADTLRELVASRFVTPAESTRGLLEIIKRGNESNEETTRGGTSESTPDPISPNCTGVRSARPILRWKAVPDAQSYEIKIDDLTDPEEKPITRKDIKETQFAVDPGQLQPGHVYRWFVVAKIPHSHQRPSFAIKFWMLDEQSLREVERVEQTYPRSALVQAGIYMKYGLYEEAKEALERIKMRNPDSKSLKKMLECVDRQWRGK